MIVELRIDVQILFRVYDLSVSETRFDQAPFVVVDQNRSGYAADISKQISGYFHRQWILERDVAYRETPARLQHARDLAKDGLFIRRKIDHTIADHAID